MDVLDGGPVEGFVGFFDVQFRGSPENPTDFPVRNQGKCVMSRIAFQVNFSLCCPPAHPCKAIVGVPHHTRYAVATGFVTTPLA